MKTVSTYRLLCDRVGCGEYFNYGRDIDQAAVDAGWLLIYPDDPIDACDCKCYCLKHKHRSVIPIGSYHVLGTPFDVILSGDQMLIDGTIPIALHIGPPPEIVPIPLHTGPPPEIKPFYSPDRDNHHYGD